MNIFTFKHFQLLLIVLLIAWQATAQTPAFPGAMGFGKYAPGARGATTREVYIVNNLNDSGPGSFREAVRRSGRIVVFAVGGIIRLSSDVSVHQISPSLGKPHLEMVLCFSIKALALATPQTLFVVI